MQKYADQQLAEVNHIKADFKIDRDRLNELSSEMKPEEHREALQKLQLNEENLIREVELKIQRAHKDEEAVLRGDLERKFSKEQVEFRTNMANEQSKLRKELIGDSDLVNTEQDADKKALEKYERQKKTEQERRLRNIELQKKTLQNNFEQDLKNRYESFEELKKRQREQQKELNEAEAAMRDRIDAQKQRLAEE
jgi:hypothetical protein